MTFCVAVGVDAPRQTAVPTAEGTVNRIDMFPLLSGGCDTIDIAFEMLPEPIPEQGITFSEPCKVTGYVTNRSGYISLHLHTEVSYEAECARCLKPVMRTETVDLEKTVAARDSLEDAGSDEVELDYVLIEDGVLDVEAPLTEQLLLALPTKVLCKEDCRGLCPKCGHDRNDGDCGCDLHEPDPRLACLAKLLVSDDGDEESGEK